MDLPNEMKALVLLHDGEASDEAGQGLEDLSPFVELADVPLPEPQAGEALIRVARASVNPSDIAYIKGRYGRPRRKGVPAGLEGTGTVVAGDTPLVGRRVSFFGGRSGTWAEYAVAESALLVPLRDDVSDDDAAGLIVNPVTAMALFDLVREAGAESFVATAAGSQLGKFVIGLGAEAGIACLAVVRRDALSGPLTRLGAAEVLVEDDPGFGEALRAAMTEHRPAILLDAVAGQTSADIFFAMPTGATWVVYGRLSTRPPALGDMAQFIFRDKRIEGFWLSRWFRDRPRETIARVLFDVQARFADGRWRTDVGAIVLLGEALAELPAAYGRKNAKVLLAP
jgi:NADPH:quinone reductase-like Zn-dependent oxidoreductase